MLLDKKIVFLKELYTKLQKEDKQNEIESDRLELILDIVQYFKDQSNFKTSQYEIRMDKLFRGFVLID